MSHELRTPLNSNLGFSEMMLEKRGKTDPASQVRYLTHINSSGRHLLDMINELLDVAKIQSGEISIRAEAVELGPAIREAATMISSLVAAKNLDLAVVEPAADLVLKADPKRLRQVLLNLLSNAVKFTPEGGAISIYTRTLEGLIEVVVSDTGIGIPPDQLGYIFREFTQVTSGRRKTEEGTALVWP